ncbi:MAG: hypothetical protein PHS73_00090 [Candidatus Peribacteraceae bacterium]|nr:hypothetical protein [Candidatus Peribacteraceae bacterium]
MSRTGFCGVRPAQRCGNGFLEPPVEQCEPGVIPCRNGAECKDGCTCGILESCGNGITDRGEECDDGPRNGNADNVRCRLDCTDWHCGDGYLDTNLGEQCDDGNTFAGDGCSAFCRLEEEEEEEAAIITPEEEENPLFFMTTALQQSNPLYFMITQVVQWNLQSILTPFANLQDFLFPQEIWSQILGE